jgi:hypothetical protein
MEVNVAGILRLTSSPSHKDVADATIEGTVAAITLTGFDLFAVHPETPV